MFARFDENPAMTLRVIKETKRYGRTDGRTHRQRENSIPPTNKVCGGYKKFAGGYNDEISWSLSDVGKFWPSREFLMCQICLLTLFAKIIFSVKFLNLQYLNMTCHDTKSVKSQG